MRIVISLALFRIMPSSSVIVLGNMVGRVNEGMGLLGCWWGKWKWHEEWWRWPYRHLPFCHYYQQIVNTPFLKTEMLPLLMLKNTVLLCKQEVSEPQNSNTESHDKLAKRPRLRDIQNLFHKSKIGETDTFKFILFTFGSIMSSYLLLSSWH